MKGIVKGILLQKPVHLPLFIPLPEMADFVAHEIELFPRMGKHIGKQGTALGKLHIVLPPHFLHDGGLAVYNLIVGKGKKKFLALKIHHGKGQLMILFPAQRRRHTEVVQGVIHPPHIPFIIEPEPVQIKRRSYLWKIRRILGNQHDFWKALLDLIIQLLDKLNALDMQPEGHIPLPVQHIADGIHPQPVDMIILQPEACG